MMAKRFELFKKFRGGKIPLLYETDRKTGKRYEYQYRNPKGSGKTLKSVDIYRREI